MAHRAFEVFNARSRRRASGMPEIVAWRGRQRARRFPVDAIRKLRRRRPRRGPQPLLGPCRPEQALDGLPAGGSAGAQALRAALPPPPPPPPPPSRAAATFRCDLERLPTPADALFLLSFGSCSSCGWLCSCIMGALMVVWVCGRLFYVVCLSYVAPRP